MAAYAVVDYVTSEATVATVLAEMETKLETLDSTTNPIRLIDVRELKNGLYQGWIIYDG